MQFPASNRDVYWRHRTNRGKVVYERPKRYFSLADLARIGRQVLERNIDPNSSKLVETFQALVELFLRALWKLNDFGFVQKGISEVLRIFLLRFLDLTVSLSYSDGSEANYWLQQRENAYKTGTPV